jgi:UDPglucose 6-dehydrogenase
MNISIIGTGYVGLCTGVGFAMKGHNVICVDIDKEKIGKINKGESPIYEPLLDDYLKEMLGKGRFRATTDLKEAILNSEASFIAVGTPSKEDGSIDLIYIEQVSRQIGDVLRLKEGYHVIVVKSTVLPETTENVVIPIVEKHSGKNAGRDFGVCMNPEFLREGRALEDFLNPDRIVIGSIDKRSGNLVEDLYKNFQAPVLRTKPKTAEMIKYANNAFLAARVSLINEIGNICKKLGIDVYDVAKGIGFDKRIGSLFLNAGAGFGGSCFPKDVKALISKSKELKYEPKLLEEILHVNTRQKTRLIEHLEAKIGDIRNKKVAVLGLAFKPDSDDIREASSIAIISVLRERGALIHVYDPKATENMQKLFPEINYAKNPQEALQDSDACFIVTEWDEFKKLTDKDFGLMKNKVIFEGRKVLDQNKVTNFEGICW